MEELKKEFKKIRSGYTETDEKIWRFITENFEPKKAIRHETEVKLPPIDEEKCKSIFKEIGDYVWITTLEDSELYQRLKMRHKPTTKEGAFFWYGFHEKIYLAALKLYIEQELQKPFEDEKQFEKELIEFMRRSV